MTETIARLKLKNKNFEIIVDCEKAVELKNKKNINPADVSAVLLTDVVFKDYKKGFRASMQELEEAFNTTNINEIALRILKEGEIVLPLAYREKEREKKLKQVIDFLARNCIDPRTNAPFTRERVERLLEEVHAKIDERKSAEEQAMNILKEIQKVVPIRIETKKIKVTIPAEYVGKTYGVIKKFNVEKEDWLSDGSLSAILNLPAGMQIEFYDKLNELTHGKAITEEVTEKTEK
ncbi:MAG TPA: ribosome assembly factor SBDS [Candidatus Pacearchaeota archaeon]|nr:MAG: ribosome assembly factor SBDS [Candidatus Pacearchaeota archaeon ex4484_31]HDI02917.1 ribosome assembly factor SBDS [Candidatus Pacearchaeota archaeon]